MILDCSACISASQLAALLAFSTASGRSAEELAKQPVNTEEKARALVKQFLDSALTSRELLVSLIERVELTEEKEIIIKFRFHELEAIS